MYPQKDVPARPADYRCADPAVQWRGMAMMAMNGQARAKPGDRSSCCDSHPERWQEIGMRCFLLQWHHHQTWRSSWRHYRSQSQGVQAFSEVWMT